MDREVSHIIEKWKSLIPPQRLFHAQHVFIDIIGIYTSGEDLFLSTEFSKLAFFIQKHQLSNRVKSALYLLRAELKKYHDGQEAYKSVGELVELADLVFDWFQRFALQEAVPFFESGDIPDIFTHTGPTTDQYIPSRRLVVLGATEEERTFFAVSEVNPNEEIHLELPEVMSFTGYDITRHFGEIITYPLILQAFDIEVTQTRWKAANFSVLPDYLVDVTAVAGGFYHEGFSIWPYYIRRVLPTSTTYYMLLGNVVNQMLDALIVDDETDITAIFKRIFRQFPLDLIKMDDDQVRKLLGAVNQHYEILKKVVKEDFAKLGLQSNKCELEPTFLSSEYGLQGRLDVLHKDEETTIIELKSGKPFRPNNYGIKADHYVQTLLYDLMIRSAGISKSPRNFILYSSQSEQSLRYAPPVKAIQTYAIRARNEIVLMDALMRHRDPHLVLGLFEAFDKKPPSSLGSFFERDAQTINHVFHSASPLERLYYRRFFAFIMRELAISKVGQHGNDNADGLASVWLKSQDEKASDFSILSHLELTDVEEDRGYVCLTLKYSEKTDPLANFRKGDVVLLYPNSDRDYAALKNQVYKSSIIEKETDWVKIRLRSRQFDELNFKSNTLWHVERDVLDSSFNSSFDSLFLFLGSPEHTRRKLLGIEPPGRSEIRVPHEYVFSRNLLPSQVQTVKSIYECQDHFLLWGPPGTGKTSVMIRELVKLYFEQSDRDIYLLAYTNRAVDELCNAVKSLSTDLVGKSVRVGSSHGCGQEHKDLLFDEQIADIENRQGLRNFISSKRVVISTMASFWGKRQLIKQPGQGILIVDEASQILEPSIIGLLPYFHKYVLVGDHLQLPAVSVQSEKDANIDEEELIDLGIHNMKVSFFERFYRQHVKNGWNHNMSLLDHQGRMHEDIMAFVNEEFYEGALKVIPDVARLTTEILPLPHMSRLLYFPSLAFPGDPMIKNNDDEANKVVEAVELWLEKTSKSIELISPEECGIITPYRAQIALIKYKLHERFGEKSKSITVDTVERYQGGARDIVIISLCLNRESQLRTVVSLSEGGVDRKFNVALTRARECVMVIGNRQLMSKVKSYNAYIKCAEEVTTTT